MIKRQHWLHHHTREGSESSSDSDQDTTDSEPEETSGSSHESDDGFSDISSDPSGLEDPDHERASSGDEDDILEAVKRDWSDPNLTDHHRGVALRCTWCGALLLHAVTYRQHVVSKKHLSKAAHLAVREGDDGIVLAVNAPPSRAKGEEDSETHTERLARVQAAVDAATNEKSAQGKRSGSGGLKHMREGPRKRRKPDGKSGLPAKDKDGGEQVTAVGGRLIRKKRKEGGDRDEDQKKRVSGSTGKKGLQADGGILIKDVNGDGGLGQGRTPAVGVTSTNGSPSVTENRSEDLMGGSGIGKVGKGTKKKKKKGRPEL